MVLSFIDFKKKMRSQYNKSVIKIKYELSVIVQTKFKGNFS